MYRVKRSKDNKISSISSSLKTRDSASSLHSLIRMLAKVKKFCKQLSEMLSNTKIKLKMSIDREKKHSRRCKDNSARLMNWTKGWSTAKTISTHLSLKRKMRLINCNNSSSNDLWAPREPLLSRPVLNLVPSNPARQAANKTTAPTAGPY